MQNFTAGDLVQTTFATLAFAIFLLPPGYLLGLASNLFGMRTRSGAEQLLFSLAFSLAATPVVAVLLTRISSYAVTLTLFVLLALVAVFLLTRRWIHHRQTNAEVSQRVPAPAPVWSDVRRSTWLPLGMALAWFVLVQFSLADLQLGNRLYINYAAFDHSVRVSFVEAAARTGVPPRNPFYGLGTVPVLRYFYYWYVVCALPVRLFGLPARACFNASVFWSGVALAAMVPLFLKHFFGETQDVRRKSIIGIALLGVTGLDIIPYGLLAVSLARRYHTVLADMEWWEPNQVTSWIGSLLWVPHHVASLTACMAGLLVLSTIEEDQPLKETIWAVVVSALGFASAAGLSVYTTFPFALFMIVWTLLTLGQRRPRSFLAYLASGVLVSLLSLPYLQDLISKHINAAAGGGTATGAGGERFAFFAMRDYPAGMEFLANLGIRSEWLLDIAKLPMLAYVYILEFGFFALVVVLNWRRERQNPAGLNRQQRMAWTMFIVCLLAMSVIKSNTSGANDLGWRGMLSVQFVLLLWAVPVLYEAFFREHTESAAGPEASGAASSWLRAPWIKPLLVGTIAVGVASTALDLALLRFYAPWADTGKISRIESFLGDDGFGERTYWLRAGFGQLNRLSSPDTTVQYNPVRKEVQMAHLFSARQAIVGDAFCGSAFGGDTERCRQAFPYFATLFNNPAVVREWPLDQFCKEYQVNVLVATNVDPVWHDLYSWVWTRQIVVENPAMRAVRCGATSGSAAAP